ncbi:MAG: putative porin [Candidatus Zixiibacteriota bacterium]|nr:MAG: putative porin [candidate division Zixibacteria bacterium]
MRKILAESLAYLILISTPVLAGNWWENIKLKGDLRYRHEMIDNEGSDARHRHRIRARLRIYGNANDYTNIGIQLATGSDNPVSTNRTLDDGFSTKSVNLDMAYLEISPKWEPNMKLTAGKFKNLFYKPGGSELLWDSDLNPEGGLADYTVNTRFYTFTLIGAGLWIEERSSDKDSWIAAGQAIFRYHIDEKKTDVAFGGSRFNYINAKGFEPFFDSAEPMGNTIDANGLYLSDYELLELFVEGNHKFDKIPVTAMFDYVTNTAGHSFNIGWLMGIHVNKTEDPGSWAFRYIYREVEKDAVVGVFTDSDFRGGGTDAKGHEIGGSYQLANNSTLNLTYFINQIGLELNDKEDFRRLQVDLQLKF